MVPYQEFTLEFDEDGDWCILKGDTLVGYVINEENDFLAFIYPNADNLAISQFVGKYTTLLDAAHALNGLFFYLKQEESTQE